MHNWVSKMAKSTRTQEQSTKSKIQYRWLSRPENQRTLSYTEAFTDEMWNEGLRLAPSTDLHYQHTMEAIRQLIS
jgi:hypothetical protein